MSEPRVIDGTTFKIEIAPGGLVVTLLVDEGVMLTTAPVFAKLKELGIQSVDENAITGTFKVRTCADVALIVAHGTPPVDERPPPVHYRVPVTGPEMGTLTKVAPGQMIATVGQPIPGTDGRDVFGAAVPHAKLPEFSVGAGIELKRGVLSATVAGALHVADGIASVSPLCEVHAGAGAGKAPPKFEGDVLVRGAIEDGRPLVVPGCLVVNGAIEAAPFQVGGWAHVKGGIIARKKVPGSVRGGLWCRYASGAWLTVGGDLRLMSELTNSRVACGGRVLIPRGSIAGGEVHANAGVTCETLGNPAWAPTLVEAGTDQAVRDEIAESQPEIEANLKRVAQIQSKIGPLKQMKNLAPQQKERATELLYEADELQAATDRKVRDLEDRARRSAATANAEILVSGVLYPGVTIRFPGVKATVKTALNGPIRLAPRGAGASMEVVAHEEGEAICILPSTTLPDPLTAPANAADAREAA